MRRAGVHRGCRVVVRTAVMEIEMLFLFIQPPPSCHCCVWSEFAELRALGALGKLSNPQTLPTMQNVRGQHTPCALFMENKS